MMELENMAHILTDCPGLIGPKLPLVLAALRCARNEVLWYLLHVAFQPPESMKVYARARSHTRARAHAHSHTHARAGTASARSSRTRS